MSCKLCLVMEMFQPIQKQMVRKLLSERTLQQRVERLTSRREVGQTESDPKGDAWKRARTTHFL